MQLYLIRHGDAVSGGVDAERALSPEGLKEVQQLALALGVLGVKPGVIVSSPLLRARQTANMLQERLAAEGGVESCELLVPGSSKEQLIQYLREQTTAESIFLVGHLPHLGELLTLLVWGSPEREAAISKGGVCQIEFEGAARAGAGKLRWLLTKSIITAIAATKRD